MQIGKPHLLHAVGPLHNGMRNSNFFGKSELGHKKYVADRRSCFYIKAVRVQNACACTPVINE